MWWWLACSSPAPDPSAGWTGGVTVAPDPVPARFRGPVSLAFGPDDRPLVSLRHAVCVDAGDARAALVDAIAATAPEARSAWAGVTGDVDCGAPGYCDWVRARVAEAGPEGWDPWLVALWSCRDDESLRALLTGAPYEVVAAFVAQSVRDEPVALPWVDRYGELAAAALAEEELPEGLFRGLAALPDPRGRALVRRLAEGEDGERRARLLAALDGSLDAGEALLAERACAELGRLWCVGRSAATDLADAVGRGLDPRGLPARWPNHGAALRDGLAACVATADAHSAHRCAEALAVLDPATAAAAVAASPTDLRDVVVVPAAEARAAVAACGFAIEGEPPVRGATYGDVLAAHGHALRVRAVSSDDPGAGLPYRLAALAGLEGAEFDTLAPPVPDGDRAFFGWQGPVRHRAVSSTPAGWDVVVSTRLVNDLLARAGRAERVVPDPSYTTWVLGTPEALGCLAQSGLATFADPPEAEELP